MFTYAIVALALGALLSIVGLGMVARSLVSAARRGQPISGRFWAPAEMFVGGGLADHRRGSPIAVAGLPVLAFPNYLLA